MKITRRPSPNNYQPYVGLLTNKGPIESFSDIEIEKGYLTARRLWKTHKGHFYDSEMKPLVLFQLDDKPIGKGDYFLAPDFTLPQIALEIKEHSITYSIADLHGKPIEEYEGKIFEASKYECYKVLTNPLRSLTEEEFEKVSLMDYEDVLEL